MLKRTPTPRDLTRLYFELARKGASSLGEKKGWPYRPRSTEELFCLSSEMSRYDPRLVTILARFLAVKAGGLNPLIIRSFYPKMHSPQTVAVMAEFVLRHAGIPREGWLLLDYLQKDLSPAPLQFYFHHLYLPGGELAERAITTPLTEYKRWGFLASETPVLNEKTRQTAGTLDLTARRNILQRIMRSKTKIRMSDYLFACRGCVSRQQALLDLKSSPLLKPSGHGRGAVWMGPG